MHSLSLARSRRNLRSLVSGGLLVLLPLGGCRQPPQTAPNVWETGRRLNDPELEAVLRPDLPVESSAFYLGRDRRAYYVAVLGQTAAWGYERTYRKLLQSRGFLIHAERRSAHALATQALGYEFLLLKKGRLRPFTYNYRQLQDRDELAYSEVEHSYPDPVSVEGKRVVVRLGSGVGQPWQESVVVPEEDVVRVKELPFGRFPGSVLAGISPSPNEEALPDTHVRVSHWYVVRDAEKRRVLSHYAEAMRAQGVPVEWSSDRPKISFWGDVRALGIRSVSVEERASWLQPVRTSSLSFDELRELVPPLVEGVGEVQVYQVHVQFLDRAIASQYWPEPHRRQSRR